MNIIFDWCVRFLEYWAPLLGMTYKELNVWIFVIIEPLLFILCILLLFKAHRKIKKLKRMNLLRNK